MKKLLFVLFFILSTIAKADIINCPTANDGAFQDKYWKILVSKKDAKYISYFNYDEEFYNYDYRQRTLDGFAGEIFGPKINYFLFSSRAIKDSSGITLQCTGIFIANEQTDGIFGTNIFGANIAHEQYLRASLPLGQQYKSCMPLTNSSFECDTLRDLING